MLPQTHRFRSVCKGKHPCKNKKKEKRKKMEWSAIWANYVLPAVASVGGFGAIFATIFTIIKCKTNVVASARKAAENTLDGVKNGITVDITEIVDANLKPVRDALGNATETIKEPIKAVAEEQADIRGAVLAIGEFLGASLSHGADAKARLKKAMDKVKASGEATDGKIREMTKFVPKTATVTLNKAVEEDTTKARPKMVR
jgi:hypothetical protein